MSRSLRPSSLVALIALALIVVAPSITWAGSGSTAPGTYTDWGEEIDSLEILETFDRSNFSQLVVRDFDTSGTPLPEKDDNTYEPVQQVLKDPASAFAEGVKKESVIKVASGKGGAGTLVVTGKVLQMDPGSRAARYWGGFGAGATRVELELEIQDGGSGKTLLKMKQERRSGFGMGGGNYIKLMNRSLRAVGKDLAFVLSAF